MLPAAAASVVTFGPFSFDRATRLLRRGDTEIALPPRVLGVLELLVGRAGEIVPRQEIIDAVWREAFVTDTSLAEAVSFLRQALGDDPQAPTYIQTVHRRGYRFVAPVTGPSAAPALSQPAADRAADGEGPSIARTLLPWCLAVLFAAVAASSIWQLTHRDRVGPPVVRLRIDPPAGASLDRRAPSVAISPDGQRVVLAACGATSCRLYLRSIDRLDATEIAGTDQGGAPFFSPDGRWVGFFAGGKLKKVALTGGAPVVLADAPQVFGAAWPSGGTIVFADSRFAGLKQVSESGGTVAPVTTLAKGELGHAWPSVAPDGRSLLFSIAISPIEGAAGSIAVMPYDAGGPTRGNHPRVVVAGADVARFAGADYIAYSRGGDLHAIPFDRTRLIAAGASQAVLNGVARGQFAISNSGALVYASAPAARPESIALSDSGADVSMSAIAGARPQALSPDGNHIAIVSDDDAGSDIWIMGAAQIRATTRLTHGGVNVAPVWSADARSVFFGRRENEQFEIWRRDIAATSAAVRVATRDGAHLFPTSANSRSLVFTAAGRGAGIWTVPLEGGAPSLLIDGAFDETAGAISPDGTLLAYQSDESGRWEIYLLRVGDRRRTAVSAAGGTGPFWSADGTTLFYSNGAQLMRCTVGGDQLSGPAVMATVGDAARVLGVAPGGRIVTATGSASRPTHAVLTLEWTRELRQALGPPVTPVLR